MRPPLSMRPCAAAVIATSLLGGTLAGLPVTPAQAATLQAGQSANTASVRCALTVRIDDDPVGIDIDPSEVTYETALTLRALASDGVDIPDACLTALEAIPRPNRLQREPINRLYFEAVLDDVNVFNSGTLPPAEITPDSLQIGDIVTGTIDYATGYNFFIDLVQENWPEGEPRLTDAEIEALLPSAQFALEEVRYSVGSRSEVLEFFPRDPNLALRALLARDPASPAPDGILDISSLYMGQMIFGDNAPGTGDQVTASIVHGEWLELISDSVLEAVTAAADIASGACGNLTSVENEAVLEGLAGFVSSVGTARRFAASQLISFDVRGDTPTSEVADLFAGGGRGIDRPIFPTRSGVATNNFQLQYVTAAPPVEIAPPTMPTDPISTCEEGLLAANEMLAEVLPMEGLLPATQSVTASGRITYLGNTPNTNAPIPAPVPLPASLSLLLAGLGALTFGRIGRRLDNRS